MVPSAMHQFSLERGKEAFHDCIVIDVVRAAHADLDLMVGQPRLIVLAGRLAATVQVVEQIGSRQVTHQLLMHRCRFNADRHNSETLSSPRSPSSTIRIFSSPEYCLRLLRRICRTFCSDVEAFLALGFLLDLDSTSRWYRRKALLISCP